MCNFFSLCSILGYGISKLGRKGLLILLSVPFVLGWLLITYAQTVYMIYIARVLIGFCCGAACVAAPMYIAEVTEPSIRGLCGSCFQVSIWSP